VWSDNNPLKYVLTKLRLDTCEQRWVAELAPFDFDIQYIPGPKNVVADTLRREPFVRSKVLHRLTRMPYDVLLEEARGLRVVFKICSTSPVSSPRPAVERLWLLGVS
jgi:hypothetical protein